MRALKGQSEEVNRDGERELPRCALPSYFMNISTRARGDSSRGDLRSEGDKGRKGGKRGNYKGNKSYTVKTRGAPRRWISAGKCAARLG